MGMNMQAEVEARIEFLKTEFGIEVDDNLMPRIYDYDKVAEKFLMYYCPESFDDNTIPNLDIIIERIGLKIYVSNEHHGLSFLNFKEKSITINNKYFLPYFGGSERIAILHQCVHWLLHKHLFEMNRIENPGYTICNGYINICDLMERQANKLALAILMPKTLLLYNIFYLFGEKLINDNVDMEVIEILINDIANLFNVSVFVMKRRMLDLGFNQVIGTYCYIDGKHIQPYKYSNSFNSSNKTVDITQEQLNELCEKNMEISYLLRLGIVKYYDGHLVYNMPKNIFFSKDGNICLTDYAKNHIEKACLVFKTQYVIHEFKGKASQTPLSLDSIDKELKELFNDEYRNKVKNLNKFLNKLPTGFGETLKCLCNPRDLNMSPALRKLLNNIQGIAKNRITDEKLEELSGVSVSTIQRLKNNDEYLKSVSKFVIFKICIGLKLPMELSDALFEKANKSLSDNSFGNVLLSNLLKKSENNFGYAYNDEEAKTPILAFEKYLNEQGCQLKQIEADINN